MISAVADDEPSILQYVKHVLQLANYKVITTTSVDEALAILKRQLPEIELVLTDIVMPRSVDGLELAARLHQLNPDLPLLFITGALSESDPRTARLVEKQLLLREAVLSQAIGRFCRHAGAQRILIGCRGGKSLSSRVRAHTILTYPNSSTLS
jgi:CheY-like chemotaxis protein